MNLQVVNLVMFFLPLYVDILISVADYVLISIFYSSLSLV
jgi:hypothetical protein